MRFVNLKQVVRVVQSSEFVVSFLATVFMISPGIAIIFQFDKSLFDHLDWIKMLLLAVSVTSPLVLLNTFVAGAFLEGSAQDPNKKDFFVCFVLAILLSGMLLYLCVGLSYFLERSFRESAIFIGVLEGGLLVASAIKQAKWPAFAYALIERVEL